MPNPLSIQYCSIVTARSVQVLRSKLKNEGSERERLDWWYEVRDQISQTTYELNCTHVIGYREIVSIQKDIHVLTAIGTAVRYIPPPQTLSSGKHSTVTKNLS